MTLSEDVDKSTRRERSIPVLETKRLTLRAPRHEDVKAIAVLANDRRIAENTARIPHPYKLMDAEQFVANVNQRDGEACFVLMLDGTLKGRNSVIGSARVIGVMAS
jgi:RimJ/RimL family protein N-acetyltransferase